MKKYKFKGFINGALASISYGTNPLFALPMYKLGMETGSILFYRYLFAAIIYGLCLKIFKKISLKLNLREFLCIAVMALLFALSSITLFESFKYLYSGIACTILFVYPIIVALISTVFFKEKLNKTSIFAMFVAISGIFLLNGEISGYLSSKGVLLALCSALLYAFYIILVKNLEPVKHVKYEKLTFYVMLFAIVVFALNLDFCTKLQLIDSWQIFVCTLGLAIFPTIISIETINIAIRLIGPTTTSILGALEPLTAIFFGILFFNESLTLNNIIGIALIIAGVVLIILRDRFVKK